MAHQLQRLEARTEPWLWSNFKIKLPHTISDLVRALQDKVQGELPSTLNTPANRRAMPDADPTRWVTPDSAARLISFLLSDDARDVSGAAIPIYGRA